MTDHNLQLLLHHRPVRKVYEQGFRDKLYGVFHSHVRVLVTIEKKKTKSRGYAGIRNDLVVTEHRDVKRIDGVRGHKGYEKGKEVAGRSRKRESEGGGERQSSSSYGRRKETTSIA